MFMLEQLLTLNAVRSLAIPLQGRELWAGHGRCITILYLSPDEHFQVPFMNKVLASLRFGRQVRAPAAIRPAWLQT